MKNIKQALYDINKIDKKYNPVNRELSNSSRLTGLNIL